MLAYYAVFNDFGFPPSQITMVANVPFYKSNTGDVYNPTHPTFGNTALYDFINTATASTACPSNTDTVDWVYTATSSYDLRVVMLQCNKVAGLAPTFTQRITSWGTCKVQQISPYTNLPVCYTTEACKYAQTAYFIGIVICQIANLYACKTRKLSVISQGSTNTFLNFSITS